MRCELWGMREEEGYELSFSSRRSLIMSINS